MNNITRYFENSESLSDDELCTEYVLMRRPKVLRPRNSPLDHWDDVDFLKRYWLSKETVAWIVEQKGVELQRNHAVLPLEQLLITLRFYTTGNMQQCSGDLSGVSTAVCTDFDARVALRPLTDMAITSMDPGPGVAALQAWGGQAMAYGSNETVVDKVLPDMLHLIDPHWYQFPPMNSLWHGLLGFVIAVLGFVSVTGNGMVVYIFTTTKTLKTPSNILVVNLAFSDFLMMAAMSPPMVVNCFHETWVFGPLACQLYACVGSLCGCASIWTMTMIAFDRYNVIVKGIAAKPMTINGAMLRVLGIWLFSLAWTVAPMVGWGRYVPEGNMTACGTDYLDKSWLNRSYILVYSVFCYYAPLLLIIYSYFFIVQAVAAHEKAMREQAKKMNVASLRSSDQANTSAECKLAKVALMTISLWFMAWTPYLVINYAGIFETMTISPLVTIWGSVFAKANAVYNPIVYGISHPKYRAALYARFPALACQASPEADTGSVASAATATEEKPSA